MKNKIQLLALLVFTCVTNTHTYKQTINDIELEVTDYAAHPKTEIIQAPQPICAEQLLKNGIHPIQIQINNKSNQDILISPKSFNMPIMNYEKVAQHFLHHSILKPALIFVPSIIACEAICDYLFVHQFKTQRYLLGAKLLLSGLFYSWHLHHKNKKIIDTFVQSTLHTNVTIDPNTSVDKLVFIDMKTIQRSEFNFSVYDRKNTRTVSQFNVSFVKLNQQ